MIKHHLLVIAALCCYSSGAFALDASELSSLTNTVREMCLHPDRVGDYLKTEGEVKVGAPVLFKIINADLSGKLAYEKWRGISNARSKYWKFCSRHLLLQKAAMSTRRLTGMTATRLTMYTATLRLRTASKCPISIGFGTWP
jgi:hypothetical protein